uniref:Uncharacterized protein n=1 Tax=Aureoumbra lagunensis TaxID=44058 RepID=A0A7S3JS78_9STRA|mmetsp:Transcript_10711/g.14822  ORF Transcript_10711/g.14822 Transcript_10711/m.14822 type:complete len:220 (+) Transcript_10711:118-777(+)|eukprot:CAMPEP_0197302702 /NCGR_PEP_ID=MMETSP0890-20130614/51220_1 /TAXON_ID=44058 ORGANISM="Aureoumbra lagunensis, Strain CCMP1510" /NCGR_SAMPLE_ID=MMETSP0890 /ASSEMBLY_ACC=CAM_ASM_000533 /LENGTH=219 /DNA_ID=CAMNT_0042782383 /DNA_START=1866 /DNA_END=2525 /DNA_ORIENTATION=-
MSLNNDLVRFKRNLSPATRRRLGELSIDTSSPDEYIDAPWSADGKRRMEMDGLRLLLRAKFAKEIEEKRIALEVRAARYENRMLRRELDLVKREYTIQSISSTIQPAKTNSAVQTTIAGVSIRATRTQLFPPIQFLLRLVLIFSLVAGFSAFFFSTEIPAPDPANVNVFFPPTFSLSNFFRTTWEEYSAFVPDLLFRMSLFQSDFFKRSTNSSSPDSPP